MEVFVGVIVNNYRHMKSELKAQALVKKSIIPCATMNSESQVGGKPTRQKSKNEILQENEVSSFVNDFWKHYAPWRKRLYWLCNNFYFEATVAFMVVVNVLVMASEYYSMPKNALRALRLIDRFFTVCFLAELLIRITAYGIFRFFKSHWHLIDLLVVLLSVGHWIFEEHAETRRIPIIDPGIIRIARVVRVTKCMKIFKVAKGVHQLVNIVRQTLPQILNLAMLFLLVFFIYAAIGVQLFGNLECPFNTCDGLSRHANFQNFGMAMLTLARVATGDNWKAVLEDVVEIASDPNTICFGVTASSSVSISEKERIMFKGTENLQTAYNLTGNLDNGCGFIVYGSPIYFTSFFIITQFFLINIVVACLMHHFEESARRKVAKTARKSRKISQKNK